MSVLDEVLLVFFVFDFWNVRERDADLFVFGLALSILLLALKLVRLQVCFQLVQLWNELELLQVCVLGQELVHLKLVVKVLVVLQLGQHVHDSAGVLQDLLVGRVFA